MKIKEVLCALEQFAPLPLQDGYDNSGLQIGLTDAEVTGALLCLDVTEKVIDEAIDNNCNVIISHHPLIFKPNKSITGANYIERCIIKAIKNDIVIYAAHTNLDNVRGGVSYKMANKLNLHNVKTLIPQKEGLVKIAVYTPHEYVDTVRQELFRVGCGNIGDYSSCSYNISGEGTFCAKEGSNPFCGNIGELHTEKERKIEVVSPKYLMNKVVSAIKRVHPYEEPAFDIYELKNSNEFVGAGIIGELSTPMTKYDFLSYVKQVFSLTSIRYNDTTKEHIKKVALCGGSGSFIIDKAISKDADCIITADIKYHDYFGREQVLIADIGHYESEQYTIELLKEIIEHSAKGVRILTTKVNTNPIKYL